MHFSREALRRIFEALPAYQQELLESCFFQAGAKIDGDTGLIHDNYLCLVQEIMTKHGFIAPFQEAVTDDGAEEYNYIMQIQDMM